MAEREGFEPSVRLPVQRFSLTQSRIRMDRNLLIIAATPSLVRALRLDLRLLARGVAVWGDRGDLGGGGCVAMAITPGRKLTRAPSLPNQIRERPDERICRWTVDLVAAVPW
jgi:hypothetical protein